MLVPTANEKRAGRKPRMDSTSCMLGVVRSSRAPGRKKSAIVSAVSPPLPIPSTP